MFLRLKCKCWACTHCGPRKANHMRAAIMRAVEQYKLQRMMTLTLDPRQIARGENEAKIFYEHLEESRRKQRSCTCQVCSGMQRRAIPHIRNCWNRLRAHCQKRFGCTPEFVAVIEFQKATGLIHLHVAIGRYIEQPWLQRVWQMVGGGQQVDIRQKDPHRAGAYISKYLSKELLLSAPQGIRRVTTSRSIKLNIKRPSKLVWRIFKKPVQMFYRYFEKSALQVVRDNEGNVDAFLIRVEQAPPPGS